MYRVDHSLGIACSTQDMTQYCVQYHCIPHAILYFYHGHFKFADMDPAHNTVEDLMLRICHLESVNQSKGVCLYTVDGMPLTDDPFFNTCKLDSRSLFSVIMHHS